MQQAAQQFNIRYIQYIYIFLLYLPSYVVSVGFPFLHLSLSFSHNPPQPLSLEANKIILLLFWLPLHPSLPRQHTGLTYSERKRAFAMVISPLRPFSCPECAPTQYAPHSHPFASLSGACTRREQVTDYFKHLECSKAIIPPPPPPPGHPCHRSPLVSEAALCCNH